MRGSRPRGLYEGGGLALIRDFYKKTNVIPFPCGNVGTQMGGFYRKEINTVQDLQGLKIRIGWFGRHDPAQAWRRAAAIAAVRHLFRTGARHDRCIGMDRTI